MFVTSKRKDYVIWRLKVIKNTVQVQKKSVVQSFWRTLDENNDFRDRKSLHMRIRRNTFNIFIISFQDKAKIYQHQYTTNAMLCFCCSSLVVFNQTVSRTVIRHTRLFSFHFPAVFLQLFPKETKSHIWPMGELWFKSVWNSPTIF